MINYPFGNSYLYSEIEEKNLISKYRNKILSEDYRKYTSPWNCDVYTTNENGEYNKKFFEDDIINVALKFTKFYSYSLGLLNEKINFRLTNMWWNVYEGKQNQEPHIHADNHFSGVLYLTDSEQSTILYNPNEYFNFMGINNFVGNPSAETLQVCEIPAKENHILLFRSYLRHSVSFPKNTLTEKQARVTIAFNVKLFPI